MHDCGGWGHTQVAAFLCDILSFLSPPLPPQPGASLEQTHIFVLAHILRRPIIVYGVKYYKSFRGETLGYTRFQGEAAGVLAGASSSKGFVRQVYLPFTALAADT